jgi:hypothetical protein
MPHVIQLSDNTFKRLQAIARPLIDTPSSVIDALVDHYERTRAGVSDNVSGSAAERNFAPNNPPPLTHSKLLTATVAGQELDRPKWNELVRKSIELAFAKLKDFDEVRRVSGANMVKGAKNEDGYSPLAVLGISLQGVDAHDAWRIAYTVAKKLSLSIQITFEWRDKEGAAYPGEVGRMAWNPSRDSGSSP